MTAISARYRHMPVLTEAANLEAQRQALRAMAHRAHDAGLMVTPAEEAEFGLHNSPARMEGARVYGRPRR